MLKVNRLFLGISIFIVLTFFFISLSGIIYSPWDEVASRIANRNNKGQEGLIELIEAVAWLTSFFLMIYLFLKTKKFDFYPIRLWLLVFGITCFLIFGEEISWGQHVLGFESSERIEDINYQGETNIHNLDLTVILNIDSDNFFYPYLKNFTYLINPLLYASFLGLWLGIPYMKRKNYLAGLKIVHRLPITLNHVAIFCAITIVSFLIIDKTLFDVGELIELSISLTALLYVIDLYAKYQNNYSDSTKLIESWI